MTPAEAMPLWEIVSMANSAAALPRNVRSGRRTITLSIIAAIGLVLAIAATTEPSDVDTQAMPSLIDALEDDASRPTAEAVLRRLGRAARPVLLRAASLHLPSVERESESSLRRRRIALALLAEIG